MNDFKDLPHILKLLVRIIYSENYNAKLGDFAEVYNDYVVAKGRFRAFVWIWYYIMRSLPTLMQRTVQKNMAIIANYYKIGIRNIIRQKGYSFINISGLAIGMACCILIMLWVIDELSFDKFHENSANLFRVEADINIGSATLRSLSSPVPLAEAVKNEIPEISNATRFTRFGGFQLKYKENVTHERNIVAADQDVFSMFTFPFKSGSPENALKEKYSIVISERMAEKYFAQEDPIGKTMIVEDTHPFIVTGVMYNLPRNSSLHANLIVPFEFVLTEMARMPDGWPNAITNFVQLQEGSDPAAAEMKITELVHRNSERNKSSTYVLKPLEDIHLHSFSGTERTMGNIQYVYTFSVIAVFILLVACINFMNLSTARSAGRSKEIGIRKVSGAIRKNIILQFFSESFIMTVIALITAVLISGVALPVFNTLVNKELSLISIFDPVIFLSIAGLTVFTSFAAGSYPALLLSSFQPAKVLKGNERIGSLGVFNFRKVLVIFQFSLSIFLIICTVVAIEQMSFMRGKDLGYAKDQIIYVPMRQGILSSYNTIRNELTGIPGVKGVTTSGRRPSYVGDTTRDANWTGKDQEVQIEMTFWAVEFDFIETMNMKIIHGRSFSRDFSTDRTAAFIVNEEAVRQMGVQDAVGLEFSMFDLEGTIIGVTKDFHHKPLYEEIGPLVMLIAPNPNWLGNLLLRVDSENTKLTINMVGRAWSRIFPDSPFEYRFLDEDFDMMYRADERRSTLFNYFSILAILIACLGLFGLASYTTEQRTKEIGIRKVLGASNPVILKLLSKEFFILMVISNITAWPLSYMFIQNWLDTFAYRIEPGIMIFLFSGVFALAAALLTVAFHTIKAANRNPVNSLKYE